MDSKDFFELARMYFGNRAELDLPEASETLNSSSTCQRNLSAGSSATALLVVVSFIEENLRKSSGEQFQQSDFRLQLLSCAFQILTDVQVMPGIVQDQTCTSRLQSLLETVRISPWSCEFLGRKVVAAGFALFEKLQIEYFQVPVVNLCSCWLID